jgi:hypothetical protein
MADTNQAIGNFLTALPDLTPAQLVLVMNLITVECYQRMMK